MLVEVAFRRGDDLMLAPAMAETGICALSILKRLVKAHCTNARPRPRYHLNDPFGETGLGPPTVRMILFAIIDPSLRLRSQSLAVGGDNRTSAK